MDNTHRERRLLELGAGNFSFLPSYIRKKRATRRDIPFASITVTELMAEEEVVSNPQAVNNIICLQNYIPRRIQVNILFEVDATQIHLDQRLEGSYDAIRFNMPHNRAAFETGRLQQLMSDFFHAASRMIVPGGKIYVVIPQTYPRNDWYPCYYHLYTASVNANCIMLTKRDFSFITEDGDINVRYPGYVHTQTDNPYTHVQAADDSREYVFEKTTLTPHNLRALYPPEIVHIYGARECYPDIDTDSESDDEDFVIRIRSQRAAP